jgi:hypothetical protein
MHNAAGQLQTLDSLKQQLQLPALAGTVRVDVLNELRYLFQWTQGPSLSWRTTHDCEPSLPQNYYQASRYWAASYGDAGRLQRAAQVIRAKADNVAQIAYAGLMLLQQNYRNWQQGYYEN